MNDGVDDNDEEFKEWLALQNGDIDKDNPSFDILVAKENKTLHTTWLIKHRIHDLISVKSGHHRDPDGLWAQTKRIST